MKNRVEIGWKEVDEDSNEKKGRKCSQCRWLVINEAIFQMEFTVTVHIHAIHLLYHRAEGDLQRREYAQQYGLGYDAAVLHNQLHLLPVVVATCKKDRET